MPNPYPTALRERAVRAYEGSAETYAEVAARFSIHINTLVRWVQGARDLLDPIGCAASIGAAASNGDCHDHKHNDDRRSGAPHQPSGSERTDQDPRIRQERHHAGGGSSR
jgi:hypothetical protein